MTQEAARQALVTRIEALKNTFTGGYPLIIEYDNREVVNRATQSDPFLCVKLVYQDGSQASLGPTADSRVFGTIVLEANVKIGAGIKAANELLEHFYPSVHQRDDMPPLRCWSARLVTPRPEGAWAKSVAVIPFWYDRAY